eukprot:TRINITY_DN50670_c0_g1_i1.p1 TRINITY_DN50670_c0_g1~~TRINITY_DN50670_c0_g1_i1.p1  ORF type:complete len:110 (-),score=20.65 TRINITY_DN50670_c0_g1_i1:63-392(-)
MLWSKSKARSQRVDLAHAVIAGFQGWRQPKRRDAVSSSKAQSQRAARAHAITAASKSSPSTSSVARAARAQSHFCPQIDLRCSMQLCSLGDIAAKRRNVQLPCNSYLVK